MNKLIAAFVLLLTSTYGYALPIEWSLDANGNERTIKTNSGLQWLSPFSSVNLSWNDVVSAQNTGNSIFDGYRRANTDEFLGLIDAYGLTETPSWAWTATSTQEMGLINEFQDDFGLTYNGSATHRYTYGTLLNAGGLQTLAIVGQYNNMELVLPYYNAWGNDSTRHSYVGQWLVKDYEAIPEPSVLALFGMGVLGLGMTYRRKFRQI